MTMRRKEKYCEPRPANLPVTCSDLSYDSRPDPILRAHYSGEWRKVYRRGRDGTELHYFEHRRTGKVWGIKVK